MADLDAVLMSTDDDSSFVAVAGYETNEYKDDYGPVIIANRSIKNFNNQISVTGDRNSQYIQFQSERYQDGIDLATRKICIHYEYDGDDGYADNNSACNVEASENYIRFGWVIPPPATAVEGTIKVMPYAYLADGDELPYVLKELYTEYVIHPGLSLSGGITEPGTDWYEQFMVDASYYVKQSQELMEKTAEYAGTVTLVSNGIYIQDATLSSTAWTATTSDDATAGGYTLQNEISITGASSDFQPLYTVKLANVDEAEAAELSPTIKAEDSKVYFYCKTQPTSDIGVRIALLYATSSSAGGSGLSAIPVATTTSTGVVQIGDYVNVTDSGVISVDPETIVNQTYSTSANTRALMDELFT